jgi:hypothetical protein
MIFKHSKDKLLEFKITELIKDREIADKKQFLGHECT